MEDNIKSVVLNDKSVEIVQAIHEVLGYELQDVIDRAIALLGRDFSLICAFESMTEA